MFGLPNDQLALAIAALSFVVSFFAFLANVRSARDSFSAKEINNFLSILKDSEIYAEEILSATDSAVRKARIGRYLSYMEMLALLVNKQYFSRLLRHETSSIVVNFIAIFKHEGIFEELLSESTILDEDEFINIRLIERRQSAKIKKLMSRLG